jgi:hypothetical protein
MNKRIFVDESTFQTKKYGNHVNRKPYARPKHSGIKETFCQKVHVWCAISSCGIVCYKV